MHLERSVLVVQVLNQADLEVLSVASGCSSRILASNGAFFKRPHLMRQTHARELASYASFAIAGKVAGPEGLELGWVVLPEVLTAMKIQGCRKMCVARCLGSSNDRGGVLPLTIGNSLQSTTVTERMAGERGPDVIWHYRAVEAPSAAMAMRLVHIILICEVGRPQHFTAASHVTRGRHKAECRYIPSAKSSLLQKAVQAKSSLLQKAVQSLCGSFAVAA